MTGIFRILLFLIITVLYMPFSEASEANFNQVLNEVLSNNREIKSLNARYQSTRAKSDVAGYLPDPVLGGNYFIKPIETRLGAQRANVTLTQPIPWPAKLNAKEEQISGRAATIKSKLEAQKLKIIYEVKKLFFKGFFINQKIEIIKANKLFLESLTKLALAGVKVGKSGQQDVTTATLEISNLEEDLRKTTRDLKSIQAKINNLADKEANRPISFPTSLDLKLEAFKSEDDWKSIWKTAKQNQPELAAARSNIDEAKAGLDYARYRSIPDVKASVSWFKIEEESSPLSDSKDEDAWAVGAAITIPLWFGKYSSMIDEASHQKISAEETHQYELRRIENDLSDHWQQALTAKELLSLYEHTIIPQASQVLAANQKAYQQNKSSFDRVIGDFRKLLTAKLRLANEQARFASLAAKVEMLLGRSIEG